MTGRLIDRLALSLLGTGAAYLLFLNAGYGIAASALLAFAAACLVRAAIRLRPRRHTATPQQASQALDRILDLPDDAAREALLEITRTDGTVAPDAFVALLRHPTSRLDVGEIYALWRAHRGEERLYVACTCPASDEASRCARQLAHPALTLLDRSALLRRIRSSGRFVDFNAPQSHGFHGLRSAWRALAARRAGPRSLLYGLALLSVYLATGRTACLFSGLLILYHTGASWIRAASTT